MSTLRTPGRIIAGALLALAGLVGSLGPVSAADGWVVIATGEFTNDVSDARTDGTYVAWVYGADSPATSCNTLSAAPLAAPADLTSVTIVRLASFAVSGGALVWEHLVQECHPYTPVAAPGIYGVDLESGADIVVTVEPTGELAMAGREVAWTATNESGQVAAIRLASVDGGDPQTLVTFEPAMEVAQLRFDGARVSWAELRDSQWRIMSMTPGEEPEELLVTVEQRWFDVASDWLIWQEGNGLLQAHNQVTGETLTIDEQTPYGASTDGRYVLWVRATDATRSTLRAYDLLTRSRFTVADLSGQSAEDTVGIRTTDIGGGALAWDVYVYPSLGTQIRAAYLSGVLPTAPRPDPGTTDPNWDWYPETGHYLSWGFRDYWRLNGGLPIFGFPLTEEFEEGGFTVQFSERQRFEWHPELVGTPYEVLLGRLGDELLLAQGRQWMDFPTAAPATPHYVPETGHAIAPEFWDYWSSHGLELGDPGISYRESVALFGFPLSEAMVETNADGDTVLTQYFERAVFEHHPANPPEHQVLLRRLGAEILSARGW